MAPPGFVDRNKLATWADTVMSQTEFPRLVRRLVLETTPGIVQLGMPAGEGVAAGSWDGSVKSTASDAWVPDGLSLWELSVNKSPGTKADEDYGKRHDTPDGSATDHCVYIEAILRPWIKRHDWASDRFAEGRWNQVRAYGLDDIDTWLEAAPITGAWFSEQLGLNPYGLRSAESWWDSWSIQTSPAISADLVLAGRDTAVDALEGRLAVAQITTIAGASLEETQAFVAAVAVRSHQRGEGQLLARTAFVDDLATWRSLIETQTPLVLVPVIDGLASEVPSGCLHHIVVPATSTAISDIELPAVDASGVAEALQAAGMEDDRKADAAGRLARRSLTALRRNLAIKPALHVPAWANPPVPRPVRAALLACSWSEGNDGDKAVLSDLSGEEYESFRDGLSALADVQDPLVLRLASSWHLVSPFDAWLLLSSVATSEDLQRLDAAVQQVLGEDDPALDLAEEDRWKASLEGKVRSYSADLRRGLSKTLALLGIHGDETTGPAGTTGARWAAHLVHRLLKAANDDGTGRAWASLVSELPVLVEAAPQEVADAIGAGVGGPDPVLAKIFTDSQPAGVFGGGSPHTHLLWALETLAWSSDHFGAAVDLLARLEEIDPGGSLSNRPFNSLAGIFCPWHPENAASPASRLSVIDGLIDRHNDIAWRLLLSMLPEFHGIHTPTSAPKYRDWKPQEQPVTNVEYFGFITEIITRSVAEAGADVGRWHQLLEEMPNLPPDDRATVVGAAKSLVDSKAVIDDAAAELWESLQGLIGRHREFADAGWALPQDEVDILDNLSDSLQPTDPYQANQWLFMDHSPHLGEIGRRDDHQAFETALAERRMEAVLAIEEKGGLVSVRRLSAEAKVQGIVGWALGQAVGDKYEDDLIVELSEEHGADRDLTLSYFAQRVTSGGWPWVESVFENKPELTAAQCARLLLLTRDYPRAWEEAETRGRDVADAFWLNVMPYGPGLDFAAVEHVASRMMQVGRNASALDFVGMYICRDNSDQAEAAVLVVQGLNGLLEKIDDPGLPSLSQYDFDSLFGLLELHRDALGHDEVGRLEWAFLPALGYDPHVPTLHSRMAEAPGFFVEVLSTVYRRQNTDTEELTEEERTERAARGYRLLSSWGHPPGIVGEVLDADSLKRWVDEATGLLTEADLLDVGLARLGQSLVYSPPDPDGLSPPKAVRDLFEDLQSESLESGFSIQIANSRGVTSRGLESGGAQEEALVDKYRSDAEEFKARWPRTAAILRRIADGYRAEARRNEDNAERFRRGLE